MKKFLQSFLFLPVLYFVAAGYIVLSEIGCVGMMCDLLSSVVTLPWSVWLPQLSNLLLADIDTYFYDSLAFRLVGLIFNTFLVHFLVKGILKLKAFIKK